MTKLNLTQEELREIPIYAPISKKQETYLKDNTNDIILWGGSAGCGKSFINLLDIGVHAVGDKDFKAGIVRRTKEQIRGAGSLLDEGSQMYPHMGGEVKTNSLEFKFKSGAGVKMAYSDKPSDKHNFQGWQVTRFLVDEASQLNEENITYLLSRLRSKSKAAHQLKMATNPDYDSFLREWLEKGGYLLEDGTPDPEMDGKTTYYLEVGGETIIAKTMEELIETYGDEIAQDALKFVFYSANVYDNPYILKYQPRYARRLKALKDVERKRLLEGNWFVREEAAGYYKREWSTVIDLADVPLATRRVRAWDKAATLPSSKYPDPDFTVGIKGTLDKEGNLYIIDMVRFRDRPAEVQRRIEETAEADGRGCICGIPKDVGAAGVESAMYSANALRSKGITVKLNPANKSKEVRFQPFAILAQNRQVYVVKGDWNEAFFKELEAFGSGRGHDDVCDSVADLYRMLINKTINIPTILVNPEKDITGNSLLIGGSL